jgi:hypothetical protein
MSVKEYLPGIPTQYWQDFVKAIEVTRPKVIPANTENYALFDGIVDKRGLILEFVLATNSPNLSFSIIADDRKITATVEQLIQAGYVGYYVAGLPWLSIADSTTNAYQVNLITDVPFKRNAYGFVSNTTDTPITVLAMGFHAIIFNTGFYKALSDLKAGKEII